MSGDLITTPPRNQLLEKASLAIIVLVMSAAAFFPEDFIVDFPLIGSRWIFPLTLLMPLLLFAAVAMVAVHRRELGFFAVDAAVLVFLLYVLIRNWTVDAHFNTRYVLIGVSAYYLCAVLARSRIRLRQLFLSITVISLITSIYGLLEFAAQDNFLYADSISVGVPADALHRIGSLVAHPVVYGAFLVQTLPFAVYVWARGWKKSYRFIGLAALLLGTINLFLTSSKGSWIVAVLLGASATVYFTMKNGRRSLIIFLALVALVASMAALFANRLSQDDIFRTDTSVTVRLISWEAAYEGIKDNFLFGVGTKEGNREVVDRISDWWLELTGLEPPADNYYINVVLEQGVVGASAWLLMVGLIMVGGIRMVMRDTGEKFMYITVLLSVTGILLNVFTFDGLILWANNIFFWTAAGMLRGGYKKRGSEGEGVAAAVVAE